MSLRTLKPVLTTAGLAAIAAAGGTGIAARISHIALGDSPVAVRDATGQPLADAQARTGLITERERVTITAGTPVGEHSIAITATVPAGTPSFWVREVGIVLDSGEVFGYWSDPAMALGWRSDAADWVLRAVLSWAELPGPVEVAFDGTASHVALSNTVAHLQTDIYRALWPRIHGLEVNPGSAAPTVAVEIAPGHCAPVDGGRPLWLDAPLTKRLDTVWAPGDGAGGLDGGTATADTWYYVWLITRNGDGAVDALLSTSATAPAPAAGWTARRRVGALKTDAAGAIRGQRMIGSEVYWQPAIDDAEETPIGSGSHNVYLPIVPLGRVRAWGRLRAIPGQGVVSIHVKLAVPGQVSLAHVVEFDSSLSTLFTPSDGLAATGVIVAENGQMHIFDHTPGATRILIKVMSYTDPRERGI